MYVTPATCALLLRSVHSPVMNKTPETLNLDVAIIGAGAAGLYSAYRLLTGSNATGMRNDLRVAVFEASERIGGRVYSAHLAPTGVAGELGAMRYFTNQKIIHTLVEELLSQYDLKSVKFDTGGPENRIFYLRSSLCRGTDDVAAKTKYRVGERWKGKTADDIYECVVREVLEADGFSLDDIRSDPVQSGKKWNDMKKVLRYRFKGPYENCLVYELGFWQVVYDRTDQETFKFIRDSDGYDFVALSSSATEVFQLACDYPDIADYRTVEGGLQKVLQSMRLEIEKYGGKIWTGSCLQTFTNSSRHDFRYELDIYNPKKGTSWKIYANDIILCVSRRGLELLDAQSSMFTKFPCVAPGVHDALEALIPVPATKILMTFTEPWWEAKLGLKGKTTTDLPLRQSFYFGAEDCETTASLLLASYADMETTDFWRTLQGMKTDPENGFHVGRGVLQGNESVNEHERANHFVVEEVIRQLSKVLGEDVTIPEPCDSAFVDWGRDPHGGAYHLWKPGIKIWDVVPNMRCPFKDERVFIAGEVCSGLSCGWVENAFCSAEKIMREKYHLAAPEWLDEFGSESTYYLGW